MDKKLPRVEMCVGYDGKDYKINLELYPDKAPITVENFLALVNKGYYTDLIFHRVIKGFCIQGGGYFKDGNNMKNAPSTPAIVGEFKSNGVDNDIEHKPGVISMARTNVKNSATSQFFICAGETSYLNGEYAAFGSVTDDKSLENVMAIASIPVYNSIPYPKDAVIRYIKSV